MKKMPQNPNYETQLSVLLDLRGQRTEMGGLRWQGGELVGEKREDLERALFCGRETVLQRAPDQDKLKGGESLAQRAENHPLSLSGLLGTQETLKGSDISGRAEGILQLGPTPQILNQGL